VLFADASGFTQLTQTLTSKHALGDKEGAEELCKILNDFFAKMIAITDTYGGDVVKVG
jgi:class 3 adenylate cyclase